MNRSIESKKKNSRNGAVTQSGKTLISNSAKPASAFDIGALLGLGEKEIVELNHQAYRCGYSVRTFCLRAVRGALKGTVWRNAERGAGPMPARLALETQVMQVMALLESQGRFIAEYYEESSMKDGQPLAAGQSSLNMDARNRLYATWQAAHNEDRAAREQLQAVLPKPLSELARAVLHELEWVCSLDKGKDDPDMERQRGMPAGNLTMFLQNTGRNVNEQQVAAALKELQAADRVCGIEPGKHSDWTATAWVPIKA